MTGDIDQAAEKKLMHAWSRIPDPKGPGFETFEKFRAWSIRNGGTEPGTKLLRIFRDEPYSPGNSRWAGRERMSSGERNHRNVMKQACRRFDRTVAKLRKEWGLPPLEEESYGMESD